MERGQKTINRRTAILIMALTGLGLEEFVRNYANLDLSALLRFLLTSPTGVTAHATSTPTFGFDPSNPRSSNSVYVPEEPSRRFGYDPSKIAYTAESIIPLEHPIRRYTLAKLHPRILGWGANLDNTFKMENPDLKARINRQMSLSEGIMQAILKAGMKYRPEQPLNNDNPPLAFHLMSTIIRETSGGVSYGTGKYPTDFIEEDKPIFVGLVDKWNSMGDYNPLNRFKKLYNKDNITYADVPVSQAASDRSFYGGCFGKTQFRAMTWVAHQPFDGADPWDDNDSLDAAAHKLVADGLRTDPREAYRAYYGNYDESPIRMEMASALYESWKKYVNIEVV